MSVASSFPCIKISTCSSSPSCSYSSSSPSNSLMLSSSSTKPCYVKTTIRSSQTEGPIRRPAAPSVREPSPPTLKPPTPPSKSPSPPQPQPAAPVSGLTMVEDKNVVTLEFQRQKAKEIQDYFKQKKLEEASQGPFFGFVGKNEISNGRWAMFGFAVGMLTEYATGSDFVDQVKILLSNFGIVDLE
ncbi:light-harvesting complex-like protein OHP2, chloroplastic [Rosa rugosa]|uniref:light-harvesting complex-like protein OHP2, chloroplastic n=1 Tax=Rosa rugosa TaxID=74645 RepID=UPI002B40AED0|nr:light-harvesting complex-like protein OHP2, chloroplastic [Rosa rugosa]